MKPHLPRMAVGFIVKFLGTIMDLLLPWILAYILDYIVPLNNVRLVLLWGGAMVICAICAFLGNVIANRMAAAVARDSIRVVRNDVFSKIESLSCSQIDSFTEASLISRMTSDTYNVHHVMGMMQRLGVRAPILLIGGIAVTMTLDPVLSSILVVTLPFLGITVYFVSKKGIPLYQIHQSTADVLLRKVRESVTGIRVIKALSKISYESDQFEKINTEVVAKERKAGIVMAITNPVMNFLLNMGWVMIILVGAYRVNGGLTAPGTIIAFLTYFTIILNAMLSITRMFVMFSKAGSSGKRIAEILSAPEDLQTIAAIYEDCEDFDKPCHIEFKNVSFSYNKNADNVKDVSFHINHGQTLGIIGSTGSGKTTIINLLMRFYDADSGKVLINGKDVREYDKDDLHTKFGVVFQNDMIFEDSIFENINLQRCLSQEEVEVAADCAQIKKHIDTMNDGFESAVSIKGANLSGGQKQRLLISRALAAKPEILILDDSSSALDYKTDAMLRNTIKKHLKETTTVIVAQRVSSVMNSDLIIVVEDGEIVGKGTHEELLLTCEEYREISRLQMGQNGVMSNG